LRDLGTLFQIGCTSPLPDRQLLERFLSSRDEAAEVAFAALMERHGPMVLRVCRGILDDPSDAEDAFQATFLVLVQKKAGALWVRDSLGPWLYGVACRVATRARADRARRKRHHGRFAEITPPVASVGASADIAGDDGSRLIHEEVNRLPTHHRAPIVLCYLEGLTHDQAAETLGWPVGTVRSRLARARDRLRDRLERRGAFQWSGVVAARLAPPGLHVPRSLRNATIEAVTRGPSATVARLAQATVLVVKQPAQTAAVILMMSLSAAGSLALALGMGSGSRAVTAPAPDAGAARSLKPQPVTDPAAMHLAEQLLAVGSDLFDAKQAQTLAATYSEDGEIQLIDLDDGKFNANEM
jgi:RNA polymerase sigma factor (sigma-70 family)